MEKIVLRLQKIPQGGTIRDHKYDMHSESIHSVGGKAKYNKEIINRSFRGSRNFVTTIEVTDKKFEDNIKELIKHCTKYELIYKRESIRNDLNYFYPANKEEKGKLNDILAKNIQSDLSNGLTFDITYPQDLYNLLSDGDSISKAIIKAPCKIQTIKYMN